MMDKDLEIEAYSWDEYHELVLRHNMTDYDITELGTLPTMDKNLPAFVAYTLLLLVGIAGNAWVACVIICIVQKSRRTQSPSAVQIYILALCLCDLVVLAFLIFLLLDLAYGRWIVPSQLVCQLYLCSESMNKFCAPFILTCMSGYCYYTVCWPEKAGSASIGRTSRTPGSGVISNSPGGRINEEAKKAIALVCASFVAMLILTWPVYFNGGIHFLVIHNKTTVKLFLPKCLFQPSERTLSIFTMYSFVFGYLAPSILFTYFYTAILCRVRKRRCVGSGGDTSMYFWRVAKTCMALVLFYLSCWTPYWTMSLYHYFNPVMDTSQQHQDGIVLSYFLHMLPYVNCSGYPILYTLINRSIKAAYNQVKEDRRKRKRERRMLRSDAIARNMLTASAYGSAESSRDVSYASFNFLETNNFTPSKVNDYGTISKDHSAVINGCANGNGNVAFLTEEETVL